MTIPSMGREAIGVFASGAGGFRALDALRRAMPHRDFVYVADTARAPYGNKPPEMVIGFAREIVAVLCRLGVDGVVVASHTASAVALPEVAERCSIPVWGMIEPAVEAAARASKTGHVGVIGTATTIASSAYQKRLERKGLRVSARECPAGSAEADLLARQYREIYPMLDTLILGCTLHPPLRAAMGRAFGPQVTLVDGTDVAADVVSAAYPPPPRCFRQGSVIHYVTGDPAAFVEGQAFRLPRTA